MLKNSVLLLITNLLSRGCLFVLNILSIKYLDSNTYGQFVMLRTTAVSIEGVISGAIGSLTIKKISEKIDEPPIWEVLLVNILFLFICLIFTLVFSGFIFEKLKFQGGVESGVLFIFLILIPTKLYTTFQNIYMGLESYKQLLKLSLLPILFTMPVCFVLISDHRLIGVIYALFVFYLTDSLIKFIYLILNKKIKPRISIKIISDLICSSNRYLVATVVSSFSFWYMKTILVESEGGLVSVANFDVSYQFLTIVMIVTGSTTSILLPMLSKGKTNQNKIFRYGFFLNLLIIITLSFLILSYASELLSIIKPEYATDSNERLLRMMMLISLFFTLSSLVNKVVISIGKNNVVMYTTILSSFSMLSLSFFVDINSAMSLGFSFIIYYGISTLCYSSYLFYYKRHAII